MATIILRIAKGSPLTNQEADDNINNLNNELITKLPSASYTANDILAKLLTVDGAGSGLDADLLDGLSSNSTLPVVANKSSVVTRDSSGNFTANNITATVSNANALSGVTSNGFIARISVGNHIARAITGSGSDIIVNNGDGISGNPVISAGTNLARLDSTNSYALPQSFVVITANALSNDGNNNLFTGVNNLSTSSANGFVYIPSIAGTPTGVPTANSGRTPVVWDATNNKLWIYSAGTWNSVANDIPNASITPVKLSTGAPSWDINGNTQIFGNALLGNSNTDTTVITGPVSLNGTFGITGQVQTSRGEGSPAVWATSLSGFSNMQVFNASGTFTVPVGITKAKVTVVGGGGTGGRGGSGTNGGGGGGGGGGGASIGIVTLTPSSNISITVGGGGGTSSFGSLISASGGAAGANGLIREGAAGGAGGSGSGGLLNIRGNTALAGATGITGTSISESSIPGVGGMGGSSIFGGSSFDTPSPNSGSGGRGGAGNNGAGVAGASGFVLIEY